MGPGFRLRRNHAKDALPPFGFVAAAGSYLTRQADLGLIEKILAAGGRDTRRHLRCTELSERIEKNPAIFDGWNGANRHKPHGGMTMASQHHVLTSFGTAHQFCELGWGDKMPVKVISERGAHVEEGFVVIEFLRDDVEAGKGFDEVETRLHCWLLCHATAQDADGEARGL